MLKSSKPNHPTRGRKTTVEPIRRIEDIKAIKKLLDNSPREHLLFTMGVNNGLRIGDLLQLKVKDVSGIKPGEHIQVRFSVDRDVATKSNMIRLTARVGKQEAGRIIPSRERRELRGGQPDRVPGRIGGLPGCEKQEMKPSPCSLRRLPTHTDHREIRFMAKQDGIVRTALVQAAHGSQKRGGDD